MNKNNISKNKFNSDVLLKKWKERNIKLCPVKTKYGWQNKFVFIEEQYTIKSDNFINADADAAIYNCAIYAICYLFADGAINEEVKNAYIDEINKLYNTNTFIQ